MRRINDGLTNERRWALRHPGRAAQRRYRQKHRRKLLMKNAEYRKKNREKIREYYKKNRDKIKANAIARYHRIKSDAQFISSRRKAGAERIAKLKHEAIKVYSGGLMMCRWCGCEDIDVLCLDHINDNGHSHRKTMRATTYEWARKHGYPLIFQVLCMNCNWKKHIRRGKCSAA